MTEGGGADNMTRRDVRCGQSWGVVIMTPQSRGQRGSCMYLRFIVGHVGLKYKYDNIEEVCYV